MSAKVALNATQHTSMAVQVFNKGACLLVRIASQDSNNALVKAHNRSTIHHVYGDHDCPDILQQSDCMHQNNSSRAAVKLPMVSVDHPAKLVNLTSETLLANQLML